VTWGTAVAAAGALHAAGLAAFWLGMGGDPQRGALLGGLAAAWIVAEAWAQRRFAGSPKRRENLTGPATAFVASLVLTLLLAAAVHGEGGWLAAPGVAFALAGVTLRCAAIAALGSYFHDDCELLPSQNRVTSGVYRWMRHPSEVGTLAFLAGFCAVAGSAAGAVAAAVVVAPAAWWRTRREDRLFDGAAGGAPAVVVLPAEASQP
jgi:protein-S-isoprenylcysteine O-methyltransferase Ste14